MTWQRPPGMEIPVGAPVGGELGRAGFRKGFDAQCEGLGERGRDWKGGRFASGRGEGPVFFNVIH